MAAAAAAGRRICGPPSPAPSSSTPCLLSSRLRCQRHAGPGLRVARPAPPPSHRPGALMGGCRLQLWSAVADLDPHRGDTGTLQRMWVRGRGDADEKMSRIPGSSNSWLLRLRWLPPWRCTPRPI